MRSEKITTAGSKPRSPLPNPPRKEEGIVPRKAQTDFHKPLDHKTERSLRQGSVAIEARLDLHGMRQDEAHAALDDFMARQVKAGRRGLLIITGKGRGGEGVLRANLAGWLAASKHAAYILALRPAALKHGGAGAFYVMLRRRKG